MRLFATSLALLSLSATAMAQGRGSLTLDAMTTPGRHFGFAYYITDRLSLRPSLGVGYSAQYGTEINLGSDVRFELRPGGRVSPYLTGSFNYLRSPALVQYDASGLPQLSADPNVARYGAGLGFRTQLKYRLALIGEGRVMSSAFRDATGGAFYGQQGLQPRSSLRGGRRPVVRLQLTRTFRREGRPPGCRRGGTLVSVPQDGQDRQDGSDSASW